MGRRIRVRPIMKEEPNVGLYVQALIALARQLQTEEGQRGTTEPPEPAEGKEADHAGD